MQFGGPGYGAPFGQTFQPYGQANMQLPQQQQQQAQQQQQTTQQVQQQQQGDNANEVEQLKEFWKEQQLEVSQVGNDPAEFKNHQLPLARIKKVRVSCFRAARALCIYETCLIVDKASPATFVA